MQIARPRQTLTVLRMRAAALLVIFVMLATLVHADGYDKTYFVTFIITVDSAGKLTSTKVVAIRDATSFAIVKVALQPEFIAAAKKALSKLTYPPGHREYTAGISYNPADPNQKIYIQNLSPVTHTNPMAPCTDSSHTQDIDLETYHLQFTTPARWCLRKYGNRLDLTPTQPSFRASITLDWYQPNRESSYDDFDKRIDEEVGNSPQVRRFALGPLKAVEAQHRDHTARRIFGVDTYLGVPTNKNDKSSGDLFMIKFAYYGKDPSEQKRYLNIYQELIHSISISHVKH